MYDPIRNIQNILGKRRGAHHILIMFVVKILGLIAYNAIYMDYIIRNDAVLVESIVSYYSPSKENFNFN